MTIDQKSKKTSFDVLFSKTGYYKAVWFKMQGFKHCGDQAHVCCNCPSVLFRHLCRG